MRILLTGNIGYLTENFIEKAFPEYHILIMGKSDIKTNRKKHIVSLPFPEDEESFREIFGAYELEKVVYFSDYLTYHGMMEGELERLNKILRYCQAEEQVQIVYLNGPQAGYSRATGKSMLAESAEQLCHHYCENANIRIKILRLPYLYSGTLEQDYIFHLFQRMEEWDRVTFPENAGQKLFFLSMDDLAELLYRILDSEDKENETLYVPDCFGLTFQKLGEALRELKPETVPDFEGTLPVQTVPEDDKNLRYRYHWFPKVNILEELPQLYEEFKQKIRGKSRWEHILYWFKRHEWLGQLIELLLGFFLVEFLNVFAENSVQFRMIDLRLLFVVIMGTVYGMNLGLWAAALESLSLILAYQQQGTHWITVFYDPGNWVPFIGYFTVGALCGYVRLRHTDRIRFVTKENELIQEKFLFMRRLYRDTLQDKKEYKKQIIGARDSFGKIFDITRQLDVVRPQEIFLKAIKVMEDVLENQSISLYSIGKNKNFARLEAASKRISGQIPRSIRVEDYQEVMEHLQKGEVWTNEKLLEGYPMFMAGIEREAGLVLLILVHEADYSQMTLYYVNLLKILCGLIGSSLLRALDYQQAVRKEQYIADTGIMKKENFMELLYLHHSMAEQSVADYTLLRLERKGMSLEEAYDILQSKVRENDVLGISSDETLYLILTQTAKEYVPLVVNRLEQAGFDCRVVSHVEEESSR